MESRTIQLTKAAHKYGNLNIRPCGKEFFPPDVFGGPSKKAGLGTPITLRVEGLPEPIKTDIPTDKKTKNPRWIFRKRTWVKRFVRQHRLSPEGIVIIKRLSRTTYQIMLGDKSRTSAERQQTIRAKAMGHKTVITTKRDWKSLIREVLDGKKRFGFLLGDCKQILDEFPPESVDCIITSPPYWGQREYEVEAQYSESVIGNEEDPNEYVAKLMDVFNKAKRILKRKGSLWLNIGDKYNNKNLMGMPWRVALSLQEQGWIIRNDVIWDQMKGTQSAKDRLRSVYEHLFHFVKTKKYYYNREEILIKPKKFATVSNGTVISATGVSGRKYRNQIIESKHLTDKERRAAEDALNEVIERMRKGELVDFRMTIRGTQRTLHSDNNNLSGRARELEEKGFFIITSHAKGYMPNDIWRIVPEDEWRKDVHYAVFPIDLIERPIKATCPKDGVLIDPYMGTGSAILAAVRFGKRGLGIDISREYIQIAKKRLKGAQMKICY